MDDFLIIGGGIAGVSAAAALAPLGTVRVLEAEEHLAYHASGRSAAMFLLPYGNATIQALNKASAKAHQEAGVLSPRGVLMICGAGGESALEAERRAFGASRLSPKQAAKMVPILREDVVTAAAWYEDAQDIDTDLLLQTYARTARDAGASISTGCCVTRIERQKAGWQVFCGDMAFEARYVVNAAGAWADEVAKMAGVAPKGLVAYRRSMARLAAPSGRNVRAWPFVLEATEAWYAKPDAGAWLISPGEADPHPPHDAWADEMVLAEGLDRYQGFVTETVTRPLATWAGLRTFAPDDTLILGPEPTNTSFVWCAGQGGYGFQTAPAAARLIADLLSGAPAELDAATVSALAPGRFGG